jgi:hypothetical protein
MKRTALAVAVGLMGVSALPAAAHPTGHSSNHSRGAGCNPRTVAYRVHGTYTMSDLTKDLTTGTYSGTTIELTETSANRHARNAQSPFTATKGADMTFDITGANVTVADEVDTAGGPTAGPPADRVMVKGTITVLHRNCSTDGFTQTVTIKRVVVTPPSETT